MILLVVSVFSTLLVCTNALPVTPLEAVPVSSFALSFAFLPFLLLVSIKYTYIWYRRVQSIHVGDTPALVTGSSVVGLPLGRKFFETAYVIGFLGSPDWETRIKCRRDRLERQVRLRSRTDSKPSSAVLYSRILGDSMNTSRNRTTLTSSRRCRSQSRSRTASTSYLDMSSPAPHLDIMSCATIHPSSPPCTPALPSPPAAHIPPGVRSPTLMQIMEPVFTSWYGEPSLQQDKSTSSGANTSGDRSRSKSRSSSPSTCSILCSEPAFSEPWLAPPFETPPTSPNTPAMLDATQVSLSVAFSGLQIQASSSLTFSVFEAPSVPVPDPVYNPHRSRSCHARPEEWNGQAEPTAVNVLQSPTHRSPPTTPNILELVAAIGQGLSKDRKPLAPTTRPLNVMSKPKIVLSPVITAISPLGHVLGKQKRVQQQRHKSCSPPIGPSPLRNTVLPESTSVPMSISAPAIGTHVKMETSVPTASGSNSGNWELDDLVKDGQLDVDAVSAVLGLGLTLPSEDEDADVRSIASTSEANVGHYDLLMAEYYEPAERSVKMGWGRAREMGAMLQIRAPGSQLLTIPEETGEDDCTSMRFSGGSACDVDLRLLGLEREQVDLGSEALWENVWEDEQSWSESVSARDNIGLAC